MIGTPSSRMLVICDVPVNSALPLTHRPVADAWTAPTCNSCDGVAPSRTSRSVISVDAVAVCAADEPSSGVIVVLTFAAVVPIRPCRPAELVRSPAPCSSLVHSALSNVGPGTEPLMPLATSGST
ncbi:unannotated protein [freshwater metagenome]|uniref:Unannotated protein n=1 Tax=freshwater metagenome TaxID=449393 RepID=A0A6J7I3K8_9ZZZZ